MAQTEAERKAKQWEYDLKRRYGIGVEEYNALLAHQHGGCAICGKRPTKRTRLAVDHDHESGRIRGLLCKRCNYYLLGHHKENVTLFVNAAAYLLNAGGT